MKKKDIIMAVVSVIIIGAVIIFMVTMLGGGGKKNQAASTTVNQGKEKMDFTGNVDEAAIEDLKKRKDYINVPMDNIGRSNPFAGL